MSNNIVAEYVDAKRKGDTAKRLLALNLLSYWN